MPSEKTDTINLLVCVCVCKGGKRVVLKRKNQGTGSGSSCKNVFLLTFYKFK